MIGVSLGLLQGSSDTKSVMKLHLILSPVVADDWLHKLDVFENEKKLVYMEVMEIEFKNKNESYDILMQIRDKINSLGRHRVVALFMPEINGAGWYDESVKVLSTGKTWMLIKEALIKLKYPCEINEIEVAK